MKRNPPFKDTWPARYAVALLAVGAGLLMRVALTAWVGPNLPPYLTYFPAVMVAALLAGLGPGLVTTAAAAFVTDYWILLPHGFGVAALSEAVGLAFFSGMGLFMSVVAEIYRRSRHAVAACEKELALRESREELRRSEERYRLLAENSADFIILRDFSGRTLYRSPSATTGLGWSAAEVETNDWRTRVHPDDLPAVEEAYAANQRGEEAIVTYRHLKKDGSCVWLENRSRPVIGPDGKPHQRVIVARDITERKRVEEALRESETRLRLLSDNLPESAVYQYAHEPDGSVRFLYFSAGIERLNGVTAEDVLCDAATLLRQVPPEYHKRLAQAEARSARELSDFDMEIPMRRPDGQMRWMRMHSRPRRMPGGRVLWDGVQTDVTEQRQAREALRESEKRMARAQEIAHLGSWELDLAHDRLSWSDEVYRIFGLEPRQFKASYEAFLEAVHPDDRAAVNAAYNGSLREGKDTYEIEHRVVRPANGEVRIVYEKCEHLRDDSGRIVRSIGMVHDVTERKEAEEGLRRGEARLAQAVRVAGLGTFEHDHQTDVIEYSPVMREMLQFGEDEPVTIAAILERVVTEDREALAESIRRAHAPTGDGLFEVDYRVARPDGRIRWMSARSQTFFEGQGEERRPVRTIGAVLDVTERKEFQARLERLVAERTAKLQELVGELEHFSYTITHDMRAPLRAMKCFGEMANELCAGCENLEPKGYLRRITIAADRMDLLITDALSYSKAVRQELALAPVDAAALLRGMLDTYPELQSSKAQIQIEGEIPLVMGNQAGLTQCFSNLLGNAVKFVKPGQVPRVRIWAETRDSVVRLWFEDNGIGIPKSMQPRVFDMFSRGHRNYEGTGIGLALVRKVMERMGGKVGVESEEGKGSRFWLELKPGDVTSGHGG